MITSKFLWLVLQQLRKIWVRVVSFAALAILTVIMARFLSGFIPSKWTDQVGAQAVDQVLSILASSMLAVTTFSLSIAVSAFAAAASSATPRATALLQEDTTTQNVLATFLGAFLFSLLAQYIQPRRDPDLWTIAGRQVSSGHGTQPYLLMQQHKSVWASDKLEDS